MILGGCSMVSECDKARQSGKIRFTKCLRGTLTNLPEIPSIRGHLVRLVLLSGLGRALVQHDILRQVDAEQVQTQGQRNLGDFVEELVTSNASRPNKTGRVRRQHFGVPLFDLSAFDTTTINQGGLTSN